MQTTITFPAAADFNRENFVILSENSAAEAILQKFFSQKQFEQASLPSLILKGEKSSGKTHLLNIFAQENSVRFLTKVEVLKGDLIKIFAKNSFCIFDDADDLQDDESLLRLVNSAFESKSFLIISLKNLKDFKLWDLTSRLKNIFTAEIQILQESSIKQLIVNGLSRRQIKLSSTMIEFISTNISRNYSATFEILNKIEVLCYEQKGEILLRDLKGLL